jgi:UBX domain-containing protein 1
MHSYNYNRIYKEMIRGLDDYKSKDDKNKKKPNTSYTGGEKSGMAVENPDDLESLVAKAREGGQAHAQESSDGRTEITITLYSNGFVVGDDGTFRPYDSPENKEFMKELNDGHVPEEMRKKYKGGLNVGLKDKRKEAYRPPTPPKYVAYSGSGLSMGGVQGVGLAVNKEAGGLPPVDESKPKTTIQIRFHNGTKASITINLDRRVADIHDYVMNAAPVEGEYQLIAGFPPKALTDPSKTIEEAGLKSAAITQKIC